MHLIIFLVLCLLSALSSLTESCKWAGAMFLYCPLCIPGTLEWRLMNVCRMNECTNEWEGDLDEDSDQAPQSALLPSSRKLAVSWTSSSNVRRIRQTWEDRWFLDHKICVINSITKTHGLFSKLSFLAFTNSTGYTAHPQSPPVCPG